MNEALALIIAYLLGSIPTAYLITRRYTGKDIRRLGGGNIGGLNTFREIGRGAGILVGLADAAKGAGAVAIAWGPFGLEPVWVMAAGLMAVVGHNWMVWLRFSGGKGMAAAIGALLVIMPAYGLGLELAIFASIAIIPLVVTRNVALAAGLALFALPIIVWFGTKSGLAVLMAVALLLLIGLKFLPTLLATVKERGAGAFGVDKSGVSGKKKADA
jgi:glycerol-3-phosphate acyltransferase PlsY